MIFAPSYTDKIRRPAKPWYKMPKGATSAARDATAHQTRRSKDCRDEESLKAEWRARAREYGIDLARPVAYTLATPEHSRIEEALEYSVAHNTEREAVIDRRALEAAALQHAMGKADLAQVRCTADARERAGNLIRIGAEVRSPQGAYTTPEMVALERQNLDLMRHGQGSAESIASVAQVRTWAAKRGLLNDQVEAAEVTLTATDWVTAIEGGPARQRLQRSAPFANSPSSAATPCVALRPPRVQSRRSPRRG